MKKDELSMPISHVFELLVRREVSNLVEMSVAHYKLLCSRESGLTDKRDGEIMKEIIEGASDSIVSRFPKFQEYLLQQGLDKKMPVGVLFSKKPSIKLGLIVRYKGAQGCLPYEYKVVGRREDEMLLKMSGGGVFAVCRDLFEKGIQLGEIEIIDEFTKL